MLFFTLCHINQLPNAHILGDSIKRFHPGADFFIGLIDKKERIPEGFKSAYRLVDATELENLPLAQMATKYTHDELLADCKPFFAAYALQQSERVIYLDCTTLLRNALGLFNERFEKSNILLVPQLLHAGRHTDEKQILNTGMYHSGIIGLKKSDETTHFLQWWANSTLQKGFVDLCKGMNADQLWLEHVPSFYSGVNILKHDGLNVGIWNLPERIINRLENTSNGLQLLSVNFKGMKYWPEYRKMLKAYPIRNTTPLYGLPNPKDNRTGRRVAGYIRKINGLVDKIVDLIQ